jgi:hypothetical protein
LHGRRRVLRGLRIEQKGVSLIIYRAFADDLPVVIDGAGFL